jgi:hypothetical protein
MKEKIISEYDLRELINNVNHTPNFDLNEFGIKRDEKQICFDSFFIKKEYIVNINSSRKVIFKECVFNEAVLFKGFVRTFAFEGCFFNNVLKLEIEAETLVIYNSHNCTGSIIFNGLARFLHIRSLSLTELTLLVNSNFDDFLVENLIVLDEFKISGIINGKLNLSDVTIDKLYFCEFSSAGDSEINISDSSSINEILSDKKGQLPNIKIIHSVVGFINLSAQKILGLFVIDSKITRGVLLDFNYLEGITVYFGNSTFTHINFLGSIYPSTDLTIRDCYMDDLHFHSFFNKGHFRIERLMFKKKSNIGIIGKSDFGKAKIIETDFSNTNIQIDYFTIIEAELINVDFPKRINKVDGRSGFAKEKDFFGQLQVVYQKRGDSIRAYEYQAREVSSYFSSLFIISKDWNKVITLFLNWISNDFGRNWGRGILFSIAVGLLFFSFLIPSTQQYNIGFSWHETIRLIPSFLKFMNPLRHFETKELFKNIDGCIVITLSNWSYLWDFLGRIFVAYGYYQTIQAFRKYGRK